MLNPPTTSPLLLKQNRYRIDKLLGSGGEGKVYAAFDRKLLRDVAIKLVDYLGPETFNEAQALASIDSQYVVQVFDVFHDDKKVAVVMEIIKSNEVLSSNSMIEMSERTFYLLFEQILQATKDIHSKGLLHLDLKPSNILLNMNNQVKVTDFGISASIKALNKEFNTSVSKNLKGSWNCLSPEQLCQSQLSRATDVFALGVLLFTFLHRKHPFIADGDIQASKRNIIAGKIQFPSNSTSTNVLLVKLAVSMLANNPSKRPKLEIVIENVKHYRESLFLDSFVTETVVLPKSTSFNFHFFSPVSLVILCVFIVALYIYHNQPVVLSTLVIPTQKTQIIASASKTIHQDNNLLVATIIEDEVEAAVIDDPHRQLVSKKEWSGTRNWQLEAQQADVDEIIISDVECGKTFCEVKLSVYDRKKNQITHLSKRSIPHSNLMVLSQVIEQQLVSDLNFDNKIEYLTKISDQSIRRYLEYKTKADTRSISKNEIKDLIDFTDDNPKFLGAHLTLGITYLALYQKENDINWLDKSKELVVSLNQKFGISPLILRLDFRNQLLSNNLVAAEQTLAKLKAISGIDIQELFLDETQLNFRMNDPVQTYEKFIAQKQLRLTHDYFHEKAYMELGLNYLDALETTSRQWLQLFPNSDVALSYLGNAFTELGKLEQSISVYKELTLRNQHHRYYVNLATSQLLTGKYTDSIKTMETVVSIFQASTYDYLALGEAHRAAKTSNARKYFLKALKSYQQSSQDDPGHEALILAHLGLSYEAKIALQHAARSQKNDSWFYLVAAQVYCLISEPKTASFNAKKAMDSGFGRHWFNLPWSQLLFIELNNHQLDTITNSFVDH